MKCLMIVILVGLVIAGAGIAGAQSDPHMAKYLAFKSSEEWLQFVDDGSYAYSWEAAAAYFQSVITKEEWVESVRDIRAPLGEVVSRKIKKAFYRTELPGAPDGEYVVIEYDTVFENKSTAVETVTPLLDKDGVWRVSGYYIQ